MNVAFARYSRLMMALHWTTVVLILVAYFLSEGGRGVRIHPPLLHFAFGLAVLVLTIPRLLARSFGGAPPLPDFGYPWLTLAARVGHAVLYALLLAVPLAGWYSASRLGAPAWLFGITLPPLTHVVGTSAGLIGQLHQVGGNLILILAGLHAAIALYHQFVLRDHTLERMSPL
jgi:superoxide oxidase